MPMHLLIKGRAECDSYYQSLIVDVASEHHARDAAESYLADEGCVLLAVDPSATSVVAAPPPSWRSQTTPFGHVAGGGRIFIGRRFSAPGFREIASLEYSGATPEAMLSSVEALCRSAGLFLLAFGTPVKGTRRVRCGLRSLWLIEAEEIPRKPALAALVSGGVEHGALFLVPTHEKDRILGISGVWCCRRRILRGIQDAAWCVIEDGDFLCREHFEASVAAAVAQKGPRP